MRNVDRDEQVRAIVRHAEIAVERSNLRAARTLRQQTTQEVDQK